MKYWVWAFGIPLVEHIVDVCLDIVQSDITYCSVEDFENVVSVRTWLCEIQTGSLRGSGR